MNFIAIDTETGGTRPGRHALLSIAAYASWDLENPLILHLWPADESYVVEPEAAKINGYTPELWKERGAMWIFDAMATLADWLAARFRERPRALMLAHNAGFDRMFLDEASHFTGIRMPIRHAWRCSMDKMGCLMDLGMIAPGKVNLDRLGVLSGQWPEGGRPAVHEAGADALACLRGYLWLLEQEEAQNKSLKNLYGMCLQDRRRQTGVLLRVAEMFNNDDLPSLPDIFEVVRLMREEVVRIHSDAPAGKYTALRWICDGSLPDEETTVLVEQDGQDVSEGFVEGGAWYWQTGGSIDGKVTAWAHIPEGPGLATRYQALAKKILGQENTDGAQPVPTNGKEGC